MEMLRALSGRSHEVVTGLALLAPGRRKLCASEKTRVFFRKLSEGEIADYVRGGEPLDKAGSYAVQGAAAAFVGRIEGDYDNVVGLPLVLLDSMLKKIQSP
jgi:septum formation protein